MRKSLGSKKKSGNRKHEFCKKIFFSFLGTTLAVLEPNPRLIESANILDLLPIYVPYGFVSTLPSAILILIDKWQLILKRLTFQTQKPLSSFDASIFLSLCWNETESDSYHQYHSWHWSPSVSHVCRFSLRCISFSLRIICLEEKWILSLWAAHTILLFTSWIVKSIDSHYWAAGWLWLESWPSAGGCLWGGGHCRMWSQGTEILGTPLFDRLVLSLDRGIYLLFTNGISYIITYSYSYSFNNFRVYILSWLLLELLVCVYFHKRPSGSGGRPGTRPWGGGGGLPATL